MRVRVRERVRGSEGRSIRVRIVELTSTNNMVPQKSYPHTGCTVCAGKFETLHCHLHGKVKK